MWLCSCARMKTHTTPRWISWAFPSTSAIAARRHRLARPSRDARGPLGRGLVPISPVCRFALLHYWHVFLRIMLTCEGNLTIVSGHDLKRCDFRSVQCLFRPALLFYCPLLVDS